MNREWIWDRDGMWIWGDGDSNDGCTVYTKKRGWYAAIGFGSHLERIGPFDSLEDAQFEAVKKYNSFVAAISAALDAKEEG